MCISVGEYRGLSKFQEGLDLGASQYPKAIDHREVHVWRVQIALLRTMLPQLEKIVAPDELDRANRFVFARDRQSFVVARAVARLVLAHYLGENARRVQFAYGAQGKPELAVNPCSIFFNLSHSGDRILIAVGKGSDVGVDIERVKTELVSEAVSRAFSPVEQLSLATIGADRRVEAFFKCWTSKESYIKGIGEGLTISLADFDVCVDPDRPARLIRPLNRTGSNWCLHRIDEGREYVATVATLRPDVRLRLLDVRAAFVRRAIEDRSLVC
jgi:4'-phosphopantetheinyl transferase